MIITKVARINITYIHLFSDSVGYFCIFESHFHLLNGLKQINRGKR